jgi:MarR family
MSLPDQVRKLEHEVVDRLKALEPLIFEYDQLRKVAERLGVKYTRTPADAAEAAGEGEPATRQGTRRPGRARAAAKGAAKPRAKRSTTARRSTAATATGGSTRAPGSRAKRSGTRAARTDGRAGTGQRREQVLAVVGEHPGITVREIGERLGVDATGLYRVVKQLTDQGRLRKDGPRLHPAEPSAATAPALESGASAPAAGASDGQPTESPAKDPEPVTPPHA